MKDHIDSRLEDINNNRSTKSNDENQDLSSQCMTNLISKCKNISELDDIVDKVDFVREAGIGDDQIGYYCSICFESVQPS